MKYLLAPKYALRSWSDIPFCCITKNKLSPIYLSRKEFNCLLMADGVCDIPQSEITERLTKEGLIYLCEKGSEELTAWQRYRFFDNKHIFNMNLSITGRCNYNCLHCFNAVDNLPLQSEYTYDEIIRLLDDAVSCGIQGINITGGEPLLHRDIKRIFQAIYDRDMYVYAFNTNGYYLDQSFIDFLKQLGCYPQMRISYDGIGYHDWMRNTAGAEKKALDAIDLCVKNKMLTVAQYNINKKNLDTLDETLNMLDSKGVSRVRVIPTMHTPRWRKFHSEYTLSAAEYYDIALNSIEKYIASEHNMYIDMVEFVAVAPKGKAYRFTAIRGNGEDIEYDRPVCEAARTTVIISSNGDVGPCIFLQGALEEFGSKLGNVKTTPLKKILQDSPYLDCICTTVRDKLDHNPECLDCEYLRSCQGGCMALSFGNMKDYGNMLGTDSWKCTFFMGGYYERGKEILKSYHEVWS